MFTATPRNPISGRILVQGTIYRRLRLGLDQSEAYDISQLVREYGPCLLRVKVLHVPHLCSLSLYGMFLMFSRIFFLIFLHKKNKLFNPLPAGAAYVRIFIFY